MDAGYFSISRCFLNSLPLNPQLSAISNSTMVFLVKIKKKNVFVIIRYIDCTSMPSIFENEWIDTINNAKCITTHILWKYMPLGTQ